MKIQMLIFLSLLHLISTYYISDSPCPERPIQQNFKINKIAGIWYTVMQYKDAYGSSLTCGYGIYTSNEKNKLNVVDCELRDGQYSCLTGIISLDEPNKMPLEGKTSYAYFDNPTIEIDKFKYLSVDYDNYAIVYECKDKPDGKSIHSLWVSSRTPALNDNVKSVVDEILNKYFDTKDVKDIVQSSSVCGSREV